MIHASGSLTGAGGRNIFWQSWSPDGDARALVVIAHGAGEHSGRYEYAAEALVADGYSVHAPDHRGHGRSDGPRALIDRLDYAVADLDQLVVEAKERHAGLPVYLLGHSMGGTIAVRYSIRHQDRLAGLILSGPLAAIEAPRALVLTGRLLAAVAPTLPMIAVDSALVSRDPAVVNAYVSDPLVHHRKLPVRTLAELTEAIREFPETVVAIRIPTLILYGSEDRLCPPAGSVMLAERIGATDKAVKSYPGLYHEILNEPERDDVLADILSWLAARVGSGAAAGSSTS